MDVTDIEAGEDFVEVLEGAVGSCDVLLAVIGLEWLSCTHRNGRRRLDDSRDFIRLEIGTALKRNVRVIPVLVEGAVMPTAQDLPPDLEGLTRRQAVELRDVHWNADVESLTSVLERVLGSKTVERPSALSHKKRVGAGWWAVAMVIAAIAAAVSIVYVGRPTEPVSSPERVTEASALTKGRSEPGPVTRSLPDGPAPIPSDAVVKTPDATRPPQTPATRVKRAMEAPVVEKRPESNSPGSRVPVSSPPDGSTEGAVRPKTPVSGGSPRRGWLGLQVGHDAPEAGGANLRGALVVAVAPSGPADKAGLAAGDLIVEFAGTPVTDADALVRLLADSSPGDAVVMRVMRENTGRSLELVVGDAPVRAPPEAGYPTTEQTPPNVVGESLPRAREILVRAGFAVRESYVEDRAAPGIVVTQARGRRPSPTAPADVLLRVAASGAVLVYYASQADEQTANDLASHLREQINDRRYVVRSFHTTRATEGQGDVRYSEPALSHLSDTIARAASAWLARNHSRRIGFRSVIEPRVSDKAIIVVMPGSGSAAAEEPPGPVVTIFYRNPDDGETAQSLAAYLRQQKGLAVRTSLVPRRASGDGQVLYDNDEMAAPARDLAGDARLWLSRAYGRDVVLEPILLKRKIGARSLELWLPNRDPR
jgi:membrane-associated protease RseP (regulator of RpoE activity)